MEEFYKKANHLNLLYFNELDGGANEARTRDPHVANVVLYQLSYRPLKKGNTVYLIGNTV